MNAKSFTLFFFGLVLAAVYAVHINEITEKEKQCITELEKLHKHAVEALNQAEKNGQIDAQTKARRIEDLDNSLKLDKTALKSFTDTLIDFIPSNIGQENLAHKVIEAKRFLSAEYRLHRKTYDYVIKQYTKTT